MVGSTGVSLCIHQDAPGGLGQPLEEGRYLSPRDSDTTPGTKRPTKKKKKKRRVEERGVPRGSLDRKSS